MSDDGKGLIILKEPSTASEKPNNLAAAVLANEIKEAIEFHARRIQEAKNYQKALEALVFRLPSNDAIALRTGTKDELAAQRLLASEDAYRILCLIWAASRFASATVETRQSALTAYSIAVHAMAKSPNDASKWVNYVGRVVGASELFGLVVKVASGQKFLLEGTELLHDVMLEHARSS